MSATSDSELVRFQQFVAQRVAGEKDRLSPEEILDLFRAENPLPEDSAETVAAIQQSLEDMAAGDRGIDLEEFDVRFRESKNGAWHSA